ncbi:MAG: DUF885 domain-containing protein [Planctomycetota bacterium]|nr:DUF885 domain-containing protein [Planctomycetota bacterium]
MSMKATLVAVMALNFLTPAILIGQDSADVAADPIQYIRQNLDEIYQRYWDHMLETEPMLASRFGVREADFQLGNFGLDQIDADLNFNFEILRQIRAYEIHRLPPAERQQAQMLLRILENDMDSTRIGLQYTPISQRRGPQVWLPTLSSRMNFNSTRDYQAYLSRLSEAPRAIRETLEVLRKGVELGFLPPSITLEGVLDQITTQTGSPAQETLFFDPFRSMSSELDPQVQKRLTSEADEMITNDVQPALVEFHDYLRDEYIPLARSTFACLYYPTGSNYYAHCIRLHTTTEKNADEIHKLGLSEVARIRAEMEKIIAEVEFDGDFEAFTRHLRTDSRFYHEDAQALLSGYRDICKRADAMLPKLFGRLPRAPYGVRPIPDFEAPRSTTAYYRSPPADGSQPGWFYANTYDLASRPIYEMEALALHEAVPGHHLQLALQNELEGLPAWRKATHFTAYIEGWGLYAESLGEAMGFYTDPYSRFGKLSYEMWRALRLVVDTGIHEYGWSRDQAIKVMLTNSALTKQNVEAEVDRYIAWPGQALAYKIGELEIQDLVKNARKQLGDDFDIRAFHDHLLAAGSMPLQTLRLRMEQWVNRQGETEKHKKAPGPGQ